MATAVTIRAQLAGDYATLVKADAPIGWWRLGDSEGYAQAVLSDTPVGYWRMDAASGTTETDRSTTPHNGTITGGVTLNQAGPLSDGDAAQLLDGLSGYLTMGNVSALGFTAAFSVEFWFMSTDAFAGEEVVCGKTNDAETNGWEVFIGSGGKITFIAMSGGVSALSATTTATYRDGAWHHVVCAWDGTTSANGVTIYVDGVAVKQVTASTTTIGTTTNAFIIGGNNVTVRHFFAGTLDEVAVYAYALSAQQVANHYALRTSTIAIVAKATVVDASGNGNTGTVNGGVTLHQVTQQPDLNTAALFDGASGYATMGNVSALGFTGTFSAEAWVKSSSAAAVQGIVRKVDATEANGWELVLHNGQVQLFAANGSTTIINVSTAGAYNDGNWHHVVVTWDGTTGANGVKIYVDGGLVQQGTASSALAIGTSSAPAIISSTTTPNYPFAGTLDEVAVYAYALTAAQVQNHYLSGFWTDLTGDLTETAIRVDRGFQSNAPDDLVAAPMALQFEVDNSVHNSGGTRSWYSLDFSGKRAGWQTGIRIQYRVTANGTTRTRFDGWLDDTLPLAGLFENQTAGCVAVSWLAHAATTLAAGLIPQIGKRADQLLTSLAALVPFKAPAMLMANGLDTFPVALDDLNPTTSVVLDAFDSVIKSGFDRLYERADGTVVYEYRWTREMSATSVLTLTDVASGGTPGLALTQVPAARKRRDILNRFQVTVHPRLLGASAAVLYALPISANTAAIPPGATVTFVGTFVDPLQQAQQIGGFNTLISDGGSGSVIGTAGNLPIADFAFGTVAGGSDLSASCVVTVAYEISQVTFTVTNNAAVPAIPSVLQCRGQVIYNYQAVTATESDATSQRLVGQNTATLDLPYQADPYFAQAAALFGLNLYAQQLTQLGSGVQAFVHAGDEVSMDTLLQREISDPISITETMVGLSAGNYWINAVTEEYDERCNVTFTFMLAPRDTNTYFALDGSTLDGPDVLAAI